MGDNPCDCDTMPPAKEESDEAAASHDLFGWVKTSDRLPGEPGEQTEILMWSPEWATWLKGMVTRWADESCEWSIYNQQDDRHHEWEYTPEFWMSPILPNDKAHLTGEKGSK
jgi:hypothetical protein